MPNSIIRNQTTLQVKFEAGSALSLPFNFGAFTMGSIAVPAGWTAAGIGFQVGNNPNLPCRLSDGTIIEIPSISNNGYYLIPYDLAAFGSAALEGGQDMRLWSQTGGVDVNQASEVILFVRLKA